MLKSYLTHRLTRGLDADDPITTSRRRQIVRRKDFLRLVYNDWYRSIVSELPPAGSAFLEIGSGAGFLKDLIPGLISSEVLLCPDMDIILDGCRLPFKSSSLDGIVMTDVFHHLPRPRRFLGEAARCVRRGGVVVMIEPWVTSWSRLVYGMLHHEPFRPEARDWGFSGSGPLSGANGALPWIVFERDRAQFEREFPQWRIEHVRLMMPFRYLVSGGVSFKGFQPGWSYGLWCRLERLLMPCMPRLAMFAQVVLRRGG